MVRGLRSTLDMERLRSTIDSLTEPSNICDDELDGLFSVAEAELSPGGGETDAESEYQAPQVLPTSMHFRLGSVFEGTQSSIRSGAAPDEIPDTWSVSVRVQEIDLERGRCLGDMRANNTVPITDHSISTYWEGEIIDGINFSFVSSKWKTTYEIDLNHWSKFEAFKPLGPMVSARHGRCSSLHKYPYIFMRWKEQFFVEKRKEDCNLTISGFYYICMCRKTGKIEGYYYDPKSRPFQRLDLLPATPQGCYSTYQFV